MTPCYRCGHDYTAHGLDDDHPCALCSCPGWRDALDRAGQRWAAIDYASGDGLTLDDLATTVGVVVELPRPNERRGVDVLTYTALHWPLAHPALQDARSSG